MRDAIKEDMVDAPLRGEGHGLHPIIGKSMHQANPWTRGQWADGPAKYPDALRMVAPARLVKDGRVDAELRAYRQNRIDGPQGRCDQR